MSTKLYTPKSGPLYQVVSPEGLHEVVSEGNVAAATIQRTASTCQTPCLLYLNIVMVEYETKPELLEQFLGRLIICIYEDSLDKGISAEQLLIRLLGGLEDTTVMLTCRAHKTLRMAAVIQQLGVKAQQRIHCALLEALVYPVSAELAASDGLLFALAEGLAELPGPVCVNDLDRFIAASPLQL
ncbi:hypothetical protein H2200_007379 [Cladophialophora chaetospira]|uniref:Uncharacterized protein n=1 Tax=Cladophialophora chaetospira TaxID=386627 RepID=A0AA38X7T3_9EURO|nr:hypothetical protein H2200_007379 [Cladophialophora chaetospira]